MSKNVKKISFVENVVKEPPHPCGDEGLKGEGVLLYFCVDDIVIIRFAGRGRFAAACLLL